MTKVTKQLIIRGMAAAALAVYFCACSDGAPAGSTSTRETFDFGWTFRYFGSASPEETAAGIYAPEGSQEGNPPSHAVDGRKETRWCASSGRPGQTLVLLPDPTKPIDKLCITWEKKDAQKVVIECKPLEKDGSKHADTYTRRIRG